MQRVHGGWTIQMRAPGTLGWSWHGRSGARLLPPARIVSDVPNTYIDMWRRQCCHVQCSPALFSQGCAAGHLRHALPCLQHALPCLQHALPCLQHALPCLLSTSVTGCVAARVAFTTLHSVCSVSCVEGVFQNAMPRVYRVANHAAVRRGMSASSFHCQRTMEHR